MNQFIIYGAGNRGIRCLEFLEWRNIANECVSFCDKRYDEIKCVNEKQVLSFEDAVKKNVPFLITMLDEQAAIEVQQMIQNSGGTGYLYDDFYRVLGWEQHVFYREWCAFIHARYNDKWFSDAEAKEAVDVFWDEKSVFYQFFRKLDLNNVIELACGRGRHVPYYIDKAGKVTLVDILEENMIICRERFKEHSKIEYYKNNGYNLEKLPDNSYTALFTYDSMVHFEMMDIYEYLKDIYRVLNEGGLALLHHSNYSEDYAADFTKTPHARCFMNRDIFAYLAHRSGFKVLNQTVIDWYGAEKLDCITLLEK